MKTNSKLVISLLITFLWLTTVSESVLAQGGPAIGRPKDDTKSNPNTTIGRPKDDPKPTTTTNPNPPRKPTKPRKNPRTVSGSIPKNQSLEFYISKGSDLLDNGEFELASEYFQEADKKRKDRKATPELLDLLDKQTQVAKLHIESVDIEDAQKALSNYLEILTLRPNDPKAKEQIPELYSKIADEAINQKDYTKALENLDKLLAITPDNKEASAKLIPVLLGRGEEAINAGQDEVAQNSFKRLLQLDPQNQLAQEKLRVLDLKGLLEFAENKLKAEAYEDALMKFKEALSIDPDNEQAKRGAQIAEGNFKKLKAEQLYSNRKFSDSEKIYQEALVILPDDEKIKTRLEELAVRLAPAVATKGKSIWKGKVGNNAKIKIKGKDLSYDGDAQGDLSDRLPEVGYLVKKVKATAGGVAVRIAEQPSATNKYTMTVAVDTKKPKDVAFEIEWELKRQGQVSWHGQVSGRSIIRVQGPFVDIEQVSGEAAKDVNYQSDPLPSQESVVKVKKLSGTPEVRLVESPSQSNSYIAVLEVESKSESPEALSFQLDWLLK